MNPPTQISASQLIELQTSLIPESGQPLMVEIDISDEPASCQSLLVEDVMQQETSIVSGASVSIKGRGMPREDQDQQPRSVVDSGQPITLCVQGANSQSVNKAVDRLRNILSNAYSQSDSHNARQNRQNPSRPEAQDDLSELSDSHTPPMEPLYERVYVGLDHAPPAFDVRFCIEGEGASYLRHIEAETGAHVVLRGKRTSWSDKQVEHEEPLHCLISHNNPKMLEAARTLCENLIESVHAKFQRFRSHIHGPPHLLPPHPPAFPLHPYPPLPPHRRFRGYDRGYDRDYDREYDREYDPGYERGLDRGYDPSYDRGFNPHFDPRFDPRFDSRFDPRFDPCFEPSLDPCFDPCFNPRFNPGYDPGYRQAYYQEPPPHFRGRGSRPWRGRGRPPKRTPRKPWLTEEVLQLIERKRQAHLVRVRYPSAENEHAFRRLRAEVQNVVRRCKDKWRKENESNCESSDDDDQEESGRESEEKDIQTDDQEKVNPEPEQAEMPPPSKSSARRGTTKRRFTEEEPSDEGLLGYKHGPFHLATAETVSLDKKKSKVDEDAGLMPPPPPPPPSKQGKERQAKQHQIQSNLTPSLVAYDEEEEEVEEHEEKSNFILSDSSSDGNGPKPFWMAP
uniref:KH homology domain-containing protein 4-like n=1 Tax=Myxine glutinosa TaxID=7769 RepID=UPI00358FEC2B